MAQKSSGSATSDGAGPSHNGSPPVIPIKIPCEIWQGRRPNVATPAYLVRGSAHQENLLFLLRHGHMPDVYLSPGRDYSIVTLDRITQAVGFHHFRNFNSLTDCSNLAVEIQPYKLVNMNPVVPRNLPLHALAMFADRHPNLRSFMVAMFGTNVTLPPNTQLVSLVRASPDEAINHFLIHWLCEVDDLVMNEKISGFLGQPIAVFPSGDNHPSNFRPSNVYQAISQGL